MNATKVVCRGGALPAQGTSSTLVLNSLASLIKRLIVAAGRRKFLPTPVDWWQVRVGGPRNE